MAAMDEKTGSKRRESLDIYIDVNTNVDVECPFRHFVSTSMSMQLLSNESATHCVDVDIIFEQ